MPVTIITLPPKECTIAQIYKLLAIGGQTSAMRQKYRNALNGHLKSCKNCKAYSDYIRDRRTEGK